VKEHTSIPVTPPALPKGGGAIQSIGSSLGAVGFSGAASCEIALPISPGRGYFPALTLNYSSAQGNGVFGLGWALSLGSIGRRTSQGVPAYTNDDAFIGPDAQVWLPERHQRTGAILSSRKALSKDSTIEHEVVRYRPRIETAFDLIEHWSSTTDKPGFWRVYGADGSQHLYGKTPSARRAAADAPSRVAAWLLEESMNAHGEHILYEYRVDEFHVEGGADYRAQRYLSRVHYGNFNADSQFFLGRVDGLKQVQWHFELCLDYGERSTALTDTPEYQGKHTCPERSDPFSDFAYGFELGTRHVCRQVLMFHYFPEEASMGKEPRLVRRLLLEYREHGLTYNSLSAAFHQAYGPDNQAETLAPLEFTYSSFKLKPDIEHYQPFDALSGLNNAQRFQLVDLLGDGLPGVLCRTDKCWQYRQPLRAATGADHVAYGDWEDIAQIPLTDSSRNSRQFLSDFNGDGRLDWVVARQGFSGFFTLNHNGEWSNFTPLNAVPTEFFLPQGQLANLMGAGLNDLVILGPRSVRLYANRKGEGFAPAVQIPHRIDNDDLPQPGNSPGELVAFSDFLGSGQQHLIRIRHDEVTCWPNLGGGRFGKARVIAAPLNLPYEAFDASRILLADLDGSGAVDLIYLQPDCARIYMNKCGNGFNPPIDLPWPEGLRYDASCQVSAMDLQGLGCSSLVFSAQRETTRHFRYDFVDSKPYLLSATNNNMGASTSVIYRSSAQEWLDEKRLLLKNNKTATSQLPFPLLVVKQQSQFDEITGNRIAQRFRYRRGVYDGSERELRGFGLLEQSDRYFGPDGKATASHTEPTLIKTWFHTGQETALADNPGYNLSDRAAAGMGETVVKWGERWGPENRRPAVEYMVKNMAVRRREVARALTGRILRVETYGPGDHPKAKNPISVEHHRYLINELKGQGEHSPHSILHPVLLEHIRYEYERIPDDPRCKHTINLAWDIFGYLTHSATASYARRKRASDAPPFTDPWQNKWWRDAHDDDQQFYYLNETKAQFIHIDTPGSRRLGLPYLQRTNALKLPKAPLPDGLEANDINYENLLELNDSAAWKANLVITGLSLQRYIKPGTQDVFADGQASVEGLIDHLEAAELNEVALKAYDVLASRPGQASFERTKKLQNSGYREMPTALPADAHADQQGMLWSVRRHFATYADLNGFFRIRTFQASRKHGTTTLTHDPYYCATKTLERPDNCTTTVNRIDYRTLQPIQITDPNKVIQEALYDAFGQALAISYRKKNGADNEIGFKPITTFIRHADMRPDIAIENPERALQYVASAYCYDPLSWMGKITVSTVQEQDWRNQAVILGDLLPSGHVRASARIRLAGRNTKKTPYEQKLQSFIDSIKREPVHCATLQADRFNHDTEKQIRITVICWDGFGRPLQSNQKVESGEAWTVSEDGTLKQENNLLLERDTRLRWRVRERVEYNNKGLVIRTYRPYFSDTYRYISDTSLRQSGLCDQHFHDPLGRLVRVINAKGDMRRTTYLPWYCINEDENDTQTEPEPDNATAQGSAP
jgi:hypothetical protein